MHSSGPPRPLLSLMMFALSIAMLMAWRTLTFDSCFFGSWVSIDT